jgi:hypothetical protein
MQTITEDAFHGENLRLSCPEPPRSRKYFLFDSAMLWLSLA